MSLIFYIFFISCLQPVKYTDRSRVILIATPYPLTLSSSEIMLYAANTRILWPIQDLCEDFYRVDRISVQSGFTRRLVIWAAIVIPVCLSGGIQALKLGEWNKPAVSAHVDRSGLRETFVPNPNQPPVFTRGFGTR